MRIDDDEDDDSDDSLGDDLCDHQDDADTCEEECLECGHECCAHHNSVCFIDGCDCCGFVSDDDLGEAPLDFDLED